MHRILTGLLHHRPTSFVTETVRSKWRNPCTRLPPTVITAGISTHQGVWRNVGFSHVYPLLPSGPPLSFIPSLYTSIDGLSSFGIIHRNTPGLIWGTVSSPILQAKGPRKDGKPKSGSSGKPSKKSSKGSSSKGRKSSDDDEINEDDEKPVRKPSKGGSKKPSRGGAAGDSKKPKKKPSGGSGRSSSSGGKAIKKPSKSGGSSKSGKPSKKPSGSSGKSSNKGGRPKKSGGSKIAKIEVYDDEKL